jgi:hypothetical protein
MSTKINVKCKAGVEANMAWANVCAGGIGWAAGAEVDTQK